VAYWISDGARVDRSRMNWVFPELTGDESERFRVERDEAHSNAGLYLPSILFIAAQ